MPHDGALTAQRHGGTTLQENIERDGQLVRLDEATLAEIRFAQLSVYYASFGRELEIRGAPSVLLPAQVRLDPLDKALAVLDTHDPVRLQAAIWLIVRSVGLRGTKDEPAEQYPAEIRPYLSHHDGTDLLLELSRSRRRYRRGAAIFSAALIAVRDGDAGQVMRLARYLDDELKALEEDSRRQTAEAFGSFGLVISEVLTGETSTDFLGALAADIGNAGKAIAALESEVGLGIPEFIGQLADAVAFVDFVEQENLLAGRPGGDGLTVWPVASIVRQNTVDLSTVATVTALVKAEFEDVAGAVDPQRWARGSDVVRDTYYVTDPFTLSRPETGAAVPANGSPQLLAEVAKIAWGRDSSQSGTFHNVLNVGQQIDRDKETIQLDFSLCRSISSKVLWDERAGGMQMNEGFLRVSRLAPKCFRVTAQKRLKFSDRTPYSADSGWSDAGQMLNFLTPAALALWVESQTYSIKTNSIENATSADQPVGDQANSERRAQIG